jgi:hypothetical protein
LRAVVAREVRHAAILGDGAPRRNPFRLSFHTWSNRAGGPLDAGLARISPGT